MKKILIVEDDFYISKLYQRTFTLAGFTVDTAMSGNQALEKSQTETYDVIMLDVMLGDMSGLDVLKLWRAPDHRFKSIPVFLSTNRGEDTIVKQGFAIGMEGYFYKSQYVPQDLVNEINSYFSRQGDVPTDTSQSDVPTDTSQALADTSQPQASAVSLPPMADSVRPAAVVEPIISSAIPTVMPPQEGTVQYPPQSYYVPPVGPDPLAGAVPGMPTAPPMQPLAPATNTPPQPPVAGNQPNVAAAASPPPQSNTAGTFDVPPYTNGVSPNGQRVS